MMKRIIFRTASTALAAAASLSAVLPAAASEATYQTAAAEKNDSKILRVNLSSEIPTADPGLSEDNLSAAITRATFDGLTRTGTDGKISLSVAKKVDISSDKLTYTFTLRDSKWSNGDPVTASDFEYAWKRAIDPKTASNYAYLFYYIKHAQQANMGKANVDEVGVKALDDHTLQVTLEEPTPFFLQLTSFPVYYPVNQKLAKANPKWAWEAKTHVGNGPYKLETWEHKQKLTLVKNEKYWDKDAVKLERIDCTMIENEDVELSMFENGELDWAGQPTGALSADDISSLKKSGALVTQPIAGTYLYKFNTEQAPFTNAKIRKAFAYAINRKALIDDVLSFNPLPASAIVPPTMSLGKEGYFKDNDVQTAQKLLAEGMKELGISKLPPLTISYNTSESHKKIAETIGDQWKRAFGVEVKLENKEWKRYIEDLHEGNYQIGRSGWIGDFNDPINYLGLFEDKKGPNNDTNWENAAYQKLLKESAIEADPEKRSELLAKAEAILMDEMPVVPIYFYTNTYVKNKNLQGVVLDGLGYIDWKWASFEQK